MSLFSVGLVLVVAILLAVGASLKTNIELVLKLKAVSKRYSTQLGSPRLIGYEWVALPGNKEYSRWLRHVAAVGDVSPYSVLAPEVGLLSLDVLGLLGRSSRCCTAANEGLASSQPVR